jgi:very-short-patch-repair endonuclease
MKWVGHVKSKHVDFVLCNADLEPVLVIEVDDNSHNLKKNKESDDFKDKVFAHVGLPLLRVRRWQGDELEKQIEEALGIEKAGL